MDRPHKFWCDLFLGKEHFKYLVLEYIFKMFQLKKRGHPEHPIAVKTSIRTEDMQMGVKSQEVTECLHGDHSPWDGLPVRCTQTGVLFRDHCREKLLQGFPSATTQVGKQFPVIKEISAKEFRYAENKMPVGD